MFGHAEIGIKTSKVQNLSEWEDEKKLLGERETLGLYLTGHPITRYQGELKKITKKSISQILNSGSNLKESWQYRDDSKTILVAGLLDQIRMKLYLIVLIAFRLVKCSNFLEILTALRRSYFDTQLKLLVC